MSDNKLKDCVLYAWVGEDELGSGRIGLKQGLVPAGYIPLVAMDFDAHKLQRVDLKAALIAQQKHYGKQIRLVRFTFASVVEEL